jgi:membrane protein DedA with SNARE-associated domain
LPENKLLSVHIGVIVSLEELVTNYGYIAILVGTILEGQTILVIGGFLAHQGYLELPFVITVAFVGTLVGDNFYFYLGHIKGKKLIDKKPGWKSKTNRVFKLLDKQQTFFIIGFRFLYGIKTVSPFVIGASGIAPIRFLALDICGALIWALSIGMLGYYFGHAIEIFIGEIKQYEKWVIIGLLMGSAAIWILYKWRDKKNHT